MKSKWQFVGAAVAVCIFGLAATSAPAQSGAGWQYGMSPGMMGGYGPAFGMVPGMMGWEPYGELALSADQRSKIAHILREVRPKHWALMGQMMEAQYNLQELYAAEKQDSAAINKQYKDIEELRRQMVDSSVDAHNRINGVLTKEQREKLREWGPGYGPMMWGY